MPADASSLDHGLTESNAGTEVRFEEVLRRLDAVITHLLEARLSPAIGICPIVRLIRSWPSAATEIYGLGAMWAL